MSNEIQNASIEPIRVNTIRNRIDYQTFNDIAQVSEQLTTSNVIALAKQLGCEDFLAYFIKNNKSNLAPYHNLYHTFNFINNAFQIYKDYENELTLNDAKALFIASLFHDFNHTAGLAKDKFNIFIAIEGLEDVAKKFVNFNDENEKEVFKTARILIRSTEFPYNAESALLLVNIMRDADMSQIVTDNFLQQNVLGLSKELNIPLEKFIDNQITFLQNVSFKTEYGRKAWGMKVIEKIKELKEIKTIIERI